MFSCAVVIVGVLTLFLATAAPPTVDGCSQCDELLLRHNFSGLAAVWRSPSDPVYRVPFGQRSYEYGVEMTTDTLFPIASNTKLYTAVALYQLQEQGKVNLSRPIGDYLNATDFAAFGYPQLTTYCPTLFNATNGSACAPSPTFVQLLAMSAGIANNFEAQFLPWPGSLAAVVGWYITVPLLFTPGSQFYYSNPSFIICGYFIEKLSGMSLQAYWKKHVWDVIGLKDTSYTPFGEQFTLQPRRVGEYYRFIDPTTLQDVSVGRCTSEFDLGSANAAGGIVSTQQDESTFWFTLFNFTGSWGAPLLSKASLEAIVMPRTPWVPGWYYAQGLVVEPHNDTTSPIPATIQYEGGLECVRTMNLLDLRYDPPVFSQLWKGQQVFYATADQVAAAADARNASFWQLSGQFSQPTSLLDLIWELAYFATNGGTTRRRP